MSTGDAEQPGRSLIGTLFSRRALFLILSVFLLILTTNRFGSDLLAFFWSLIVLAGVMYFDG